MDNILVLDCTLRDGGYVNDNNFGYQNINKIIEALNESKVDIIECGYIKDDKEEYSKDITEFNTFEDFHDNHNYLLQDDRDYTLMLLGEKYKIENLPESNSDKNIIRMTFHKHNVEKALEYAKIIQDKGYKLFIQPTVTKGYEDDELINFIEEVNKLKPYCVGIVDTFGEMKEQDVVRLCNIYDKYLDKDILIGFHAHNNLQLAFSNAMVFIRELKDSRKIVIDTSIYGMGRGAGNLPTELLVSYLNEQYGKNYNVEPLLRISDDVISKIKDENNWGYSLEYYLSAVNSIHPSYVINFMNRKTLNTQDIGNLLNLISYDKRKEYNGEYADELYNSYNNNKVDDEKSYEKIKNLVVNKNVLLIGPGVTIKKHKKEIEKLMHKKNIVSISVNNKLMYDTDYIFISNKKRYEDIEFDKDDKLILTSNIKKESDDEIIFDYQNSLSRVHDISDNSLLVLLNILSKVTNDVTIAGFDGYSRDKDKNYYDRKIQLILDNNYINDLNVFIKDNIDEYSKKMNIKTITPTMYIRRNK